MPGNGRSRTRFRVRAQGVQGEDLSKKLQKSERLPGGSGTGQELEEPRGVLRAFQAQARRPALLSTRQLQRGDRE